MRRLTGLLLLIWLPFLLSAQIKREKRGTPEKESKRGYKATFDDRRSAFFFGGGPRLFYHGGSYFHDKDQNDAQVLIVKEELKSFSPGLGIFLGKNIPFYKRSDKLAFNLEPGLSFSAAGFSKPGYVAALEVPVYLTVRYGAGASLKLNDTLGYGIGIGAVGGALFQGLPVSKIPYILPAAMAEIRLRRKEQLWYLRLHLPLASIKYDYETTNGTLEGFRIRSFGISIMRD